MQIIFAEEGFDTADLTQELELVVFSPQKKTPTLLFRGIASSPPIPLGNGLLQTTFYATQNDPALSPTPHDLSPVTLSTPQIKWIVPPLPGGVHLVLQAEWTQSCAGEMDLMPAIASHFPSGMVNSLNPSLRFDSLVHKTGYQILEEEVNLITPPDTGILNMYPAATPPIPIPNQGRITPTKLPRYWFHGKLVVGWEYHQKRVERAHLWLPILPGASADPNAPEVYLKIENIESTENFDATAAEFFTTEKTFPVIQKAIEEAKKEVVRRYQPTLQFTINWAEALLRYGAITLGQPIQLQIGKQKLSGTVRAIETDLSYKKRIATLTCAIQTPLLSEWQQSHLEVSQWQNPDPVQGLAQMPQKESDLLQNVEIANNALQQIQGLQELSAPSQDAISTYLQQHPTQASIRLRSLKTHKYLGRDVYASLIPTPISKGV